MTGAEGRSFRVWRLWLGRLLLVLLLAWMLWDVLFSDHGYRVYQAEKAEVQRLRAEIEAMTAEREKLAREILRLRNDPKALEELVHRDLGYVYPDEFMLLMPEDKPASQPDPERSR